MALRWRFSAAPPAAPKRCVGARSQPTRPTVSPIFDEDHRFPYIDQFVHRDGAVLNSDDIIRMLSPMLQQERLDKIAQVGHAMLGCHAVFLPCSSSCTGCAKAGRNGRTDEQPHT